MLREEKLLRLEAERRDSRRLPAFSPCRQHGAEDTHPNADGWQSALSCPSSPSCKQSPSGLCPEALAAQHCHGNQCREGRELRACPPGAATVQSPEPRQRFSKPQRAKQSRLLSVGGCKCPAPLPQPLRLLCLQPGRARQRTAQPAQHRNPLLAAGHIARPPASGFWSPTPPGSTDVPEAKPFL